MPKPIVHANHDAKKFGGQANDYMAIHQVMDSSKAAFPSNQHRAVLHSSFGIFLMEQMFGVDFDKLNELKEKHQWTDEEVEDIIGFKQHCTFHGTEILNSNKRRVPVRDVAESHCLIDFNGRFIPSLADYLEVMECKDWMCNGKDGQVPPSFEKIHNKKRVLKLSQVELVD